MLIKILFIQQFILLFIIAIKTNKRTREKEKKKKKRLQFSNRNIKRGFFSSVLGRNRSNSLCHDILYPHHVCLKEREQQPLTIGSKKERKRGKNSVENDIASFCWVWIGSNLVLYMLCVYVEKLFNSTGIDFSSFDWKERQIYIDLEKIGSHLTWYNFFSSVHDFYHSIPVFGDKETKKLRTLEYTQTTVYVGSNKLSFLLWAPEIRKLVLIWEFLFDWDSVFVCGKYDFKNKYAFYEFSSFSGS